MAKASIPASIRNSSAEGLHKYALALLKEKEEEQGKIFAVAVAGRKYIHEESDTAGYLFDVIQQLAEDASCSNDLRSVISQLAELAAAQAA
jgi:hypothetical protein